MGIYNRDYMRDANYRGDGGIRHPRHWSLVTWIIVVNVLVHLVEVLVFDTERIGTVTRGELFAGHVYLLLTYQFVHADLWHLGLNMLMLHFMGRQLLERIGAKPFSLLYLGAGVLGGLVQVLYSPNPILGASAAVFGVLFGLITLAPQQMVYLMLFFVIPVRARMWKIGLWVAVFEVGLFLMQEFGQPFGRHGIANLAHLGGAFFGWFWIAYLLPVFEGRTADRERAERWSRQFGAKRVVEAEVIEEKNPERKSPKPFVSKEIDAILDKISAHGMHSLTEAEREMLQKGSDSLSRRMDGK